MWNCLLIQQVENVLAEKFGEKITISTSRYIGGGCINNAAKIETNVGAFFLKSNADCSPDIFIREAESLNELKKAAGDFLHVPEVFAAEKVDSTPGFLVLEYLIPHESKNGDDEQLGRGLAMIHQYKNENFGFYHDNYCGATRQNNLWTSSWCEFFRDNRIVFLLDLIQKKRPLPVAELKIYEKLLLKIPDLVPDKSQSVLIHGDLWAGNYMISGGGPALIDPAAYYADREMEFAIITMFGGFSSGFYSAYNEICPLLNDWKERNGLYRLYHILNHYYLFGGAYRLQALQIAKSYL